MEYLQYYFSKSFLSICVSSFKPCYKWNTFNTNKSILVFTIYEVLNLVISGIPSILENSRIYISDEGLVLNLVISGIPSILINGLMGDDPKYVF